LVRNRSYSDEYFKRVARDLKSIPCLLLLGNIFAFVFLIIWSNIAKHLLTSAIETTMAPPMETTPSLIRSIRDHYTCNKPRCGAAGHALAYSINTTADPCRDIVEHVCSNWLLSSEENYQKVILGSARLYLEDMYRDIKRYLEKMNIHANRPDASQKVAMVYHHCLNAKLTLQDLINVMRKYQLQGWPFSNIVETNFLGLLPKVLQKTMIEPILSVRTSRHLQKPLTENRIATPDEDEILLTLDCPTFTIPRHKLIMSQGEAMTAYKTYLRRSISHFTGTNVPHHEAILKFELSNAIMVRNLCHRRPLKTLSLSTLQSEIPKVSWKLFLQSIIGDDSSVILKPETRVLVRSENYLRYFASLKQAPKDLQAVNYVGWRLLDYYGRQTLREMTEDHDAFLRKAFKESIEPMWKKCLMTTNDIMPMAMGRVYVDAIIKIDTFLAAQELVSKLKFGFKYLLSRAYWLDKEQKSRAYKRIGDMKTMIGIPPWISNDSTLNEYYQNFTPHGNYLTIFSSAAEHTAKLRFLTLTIQQEKVVDLHLHHQNLRQSLIYDVNENALLLPAGLLQPPFFDPNVPHALNYGGLGVLMLNDMIREFFRFFFNDNKNTWRSAVKCITDRVYRKEDSQSGSLEESYKVFTVIFTMMTLRTAYNAYHYYLDMDDDFVIPGLKGTTNPDQLFFLSAVRTLCSQVRDEHRALLIINEGVTLMKKVKAALQGLDELQDAFNCRNEKRNSYVYCVETKGDAAEDD
ncbi:neprilysin, putative, partial [Ixodes scapularis]